RRSRTTERDWPRPATTRRTSTPGWSPVPRSHRTAPTPPATGCRSPRRRRPRRARHRGIVRVLRVLALDYGAARCGAALSDPTGTLVRPLEAVEPPDPARIADLVAEHQVERVIVGLPTTLRGEEGEQARLSRAFAAELAELLDVPVETYDERLTTRM